MKAEYVLSLALIIAAFVVSAWAYPNVPDKVAGHWNASGEVNGYMPKFWGLFLMPFVMALMLPLFMAIPRIDPLKKNILQFIGYFRMLVLVLFGFFFYIHMLIIFANLGVAFNMTVMMLPAIALLFYFLGIVIENARQNWFVGIRTPWTLSSRRVWDRTHKLGGKLFRVVALLALAATFMGEFGLFVFIAAAIAVSFYLVAYSYFEYRKESGK